MKQAATATRRIQCKVAEVEATDAIPPAEEPRAPTGDSATRHRSAPMALLPHGLEVQRRRSLTDLAPESQPILAGATEMDPGIDPGVGALARRLREARERSR